jgi:hypothetical protein
MTHHPAQTTSHLPQPPRPNTPPGNFQPTLWNQLEANRRRQLAQHLAHLIRRLRDQRHLPEDGQHDDDR